MAGMAKGFLFHWVGKQMKVRPEFSPLPNGPHRFNFQAKIDGINYIAFGGGPSKKEAEAAAARDLLSYLVKKGIIPVDAVPPNMLTIQNSATSSAVEINNPFKQLPSNFSCPHELVNQSIVPKIENMPSEMSSSNNYSVNQLPPGANQQLNKRLKLEEVEEIDSNAHLHGNWTVKNAKPRLHQFLNKNRIPADFKYFCEGPDHERFFCAEMSFWLKDVNRNIVGKGIASTKKLASQICSVNLVHQLYHMGIIEGADAIQIGAKKKIQPVIPIWNVALNPDAEKHLHHVLYLSKVQPVEEPKIDEKINLKVPIHCCNHDNVDETQIVNWEPPSPKWNPWLAQPIPFEGAEGNMPPPSAAFIYDEFQDKWEDNNFTSMLEERKKLPVYKHKQQIIDLVYDNQVVIIRGATGCGKTTQVPQYILDDFILKSVGDQCNVVVTQPRRISATSIAERVATERSECLGNSIGYSVRFDSILPRSHGSIMFCTTGVLLRRMENGLTGISHVVVDEIHERDINSDFLLIILREMLYTFPKLRIILMSATIDTKMFSQYFNNCPVLEIEGFMHPVQEYFLEDIIQMLQFVPTLLEKRKNKDVDVDGEENLNIVCGTEYSMQTRNSMAQLNESEISIGIIEALLLYITSMDVPGAVLIFLPGWSVIFNLLRHLQQHLLFGSQRFLLLPLHSQIPRGDQGRVFKPAPHGVRKIILSTNIAETSITIDDVVFVVDSCKVKIKQFTSHNNMTNYATVWASQSNLDQRKGRAGRVQSGFCFHLVSRARYQKLAQHMTPEILRTPLHLLVLNIKLLKLGKVVDFLNKAIESPPMHAVIDSLILLKEMQALGDNECLTPLGYILAKLPIEPRLGKMIILGCIFNVGDAMCSIAASMCFPEPFEKPVEHKRLGWVHKKFSGTRNSDHIAMLWAYQQWENARVSGVIAEENFSRNHELNLLTLRMTADAKQQLKDLLCALGFPEESMHPRPFNFRGIDEQLDLVTGILCVGLYPNICMHREKRKVLTTEGKIAIIHKSSVVCSNEKIFFPSPFFIFGEKIRTQAVSCKQLTMIYPVQYLIFTSCKAEACHRAINIDEWLELKIPFQQAASLVAFRNVVENLIVRVSSDPKMISKMSSQDNDTLNLVRVLSRCDSGLYMIQNQNYGPKEGTSTFESFQNACQQDYISPNVPILRFHNTKPRGYQGPQYFYGGRHGNRGRGAFGGGYGGW